MLNSVIDDISRDVEKRRLERLPDLCPTAHDPSPLSGLVDAKTLP
jgi:hypothetical protein